MSLTYGPLAHDLMFRNGFFLVEKRVVFWVNACFAREKPSCEQ